MQRLTLYTSLLVLLTLFGCSKKDEEGLPYNPTNQGLVVFELIRNNVYTISSLSEAHTIKVTLRDMDGKEFTLPSLELSGNEDRISTKPYPLNVGLYEVTGYRCYDLQADLIDDLDITLTEDNIIEVEAGEELPIFLPTYVKNPLTTSNLYNTLYGICLEILGDDESLWPESWDFASGEIDINWAGLEFDTDANSNPTDVIGLIIDGSPQYVINSDTGEEILVSLPEFKDMSILPACVTNLTALQSIVIRNCAMELLPSELEHSFINNLTIEHTDLSSLPKELGNMTSLTSVSFDGNKFTEFPECLSNVKSMEIFSINNERISDIPASIANWGDNLISLSICNTDISSIPDVFDKLWHVSTLDLSGNRQLSELPATVGLEKIPYDNTGNYSFTALRGVILKDCAFTAIPSEVQRKGLQHLDLSNNNITSVNKEEIEKMEDIEALILDGNKLSSFPTLSNPKLTMLSLIGTGLTRDQVDLSKLPKLNPRYVFFTQEEYNSVFGTSK